jgi:hypothetical protein
MQTGNKRFDDIDIIEFWHVTWFGGSLANRTETPWETHKSKTVIFGIKFWKENCFLHSDACRKLFNSLKSAMCILQNVFGSQFPILLALFEYGFVLYLKKAVKIADLDEATHCSKVEMNGIK